MLHSTVDITADWTGWTASTGVVVLRPEFDWEGAGPDGDGRSWLLYAVAGESEIALAEIDWDG